MSDILTLVLLILRLHLFIAFSAVPTNPFEGCFLLWIHQKNAFLQPVVLSASSHSTFYIKKSVYCSINFNLPRVAPRPLGPFFFFFFLVLFLTLMTLKILQFDWLIANEMISWLQITRKSSTITDDWQSHRRIAIITLKFPKISRKCPKSRHGLFSSLARDHKRRGHQYTFVSLQWN